MNKHMYRRLTTSMTLDTDLLDLIDQESFDLNISRSRLVENIMKQHYQDLGVYADAKEYFRK